MVRTCCGNIVDRLLPGNKEEHVAWFDSAPRVPAPVRHSGRELRGVNGTRSVAGCGGRNGMSASMRSASRSRLGHGVVPEDLTGSPPESAGRQTMRLARTPRYRSESGNTTANSSARYQAEALSILSIRIHTEKWGLLARNEERSQAAARRLSQRIDGGRHTRHETGQGTVCLRPTGESIALFEDRGATLLCGLQRHRRQTRRRYGGREMGALLPIAARGVCPRRSPPPKISVPAIVGQPV
jgi:hypothetical protein